MFHAPMMNKLIQFDQLIAESVPESLFADSIRLQQLIMNLLGNALKFTASGGRIGLSIELDDSVSDLLEGSLPLRITVSDSGIGIDESRLAKIFDAYQQAESHTSRIYGGTGLGLSLCRQITHLMGGDIGVTSKLGEGSIFCANIVVQKTDSDRAQQLSGPISGAVISGMKVLVAEDNPTNRKVIEMLLHKLGVDAAVVHNGQQLLDCIDAYSPDLVLMDCHMPVMDGFEATRTLRQRGISTPIFALTAGVSTEERVECANIGMNEVLTKPVTFQSLSAALQKVAG